MEEHLGTPAWDEWRPDSRLWSRALEDRNDDEHAALRRRLRRSHQHARIAVEPIASEIDRDLPQFTVHDATNHLDPLWKLVDLVAPDELLLTPTEAWTLGVAILLHDLGLAIAAYPGGPEELRTTQGWDDALAMALRSRLERSPSAHDFAEASEEDKTEADRTMLRRRHADRAAELTAAVFASGPVVQDQGLRDGLGELAGRIAASHWWPARRLVELGTIRGAPAGFPSHWTLRPVLLAVLLRVADAAHLDALRAPKNRRQDRELSEFSAHHWDFQQRLAQPVLDHERLRFSSTEAFDVQHADAWWLCVQHLRVLERELRDGNGLLADLNEPTLAARAVADIGDLDRLAEDIRVVGWTPVDARVQVSDVARLVTTLGGRQLYGPAIAVPIRELIQNGADAVRAKRALEADFTGRVLVRVAADWSWMAIEDNGVGMDSRVLSGALLDFGRSLWTSPELADVHPGLQAAGFRPAGRFGIGFFACFMWSSSVTVTSRARDAGRSDTKVLVLRGAAGRPIVRPAEEAERLNESGTRVVLHSPDLDEHTREFTSGRDDRLSAEDLGWLVAWLAPALPVDLLIQVGDEAPRRVVAANDWLELPPEDLLERVGASTGAAPRLEPLTSGDTPVGRLALVERYYGPYDENVNGPCALVTGGIRAGHSRDAAGLVAIDSVDVARSTGSPLASPEEVSRWATSQAMKLSGAHDTRNFAAIVLHFGGYTGHLALARTSVGLLSRAQFVDWARERTEIKLMDVDDVITEAREDQWISPDPRIELPDEIADAPLDSSWALPGQLLRGARRSTLTDALTEAIAEAWADSEFGPSEYEDAAFFADGDEVVGACRAFRRFPAE